MCHGNCADMRSAGIGSSCVCSGGGADHADLFGFVPQGEKGTADHKVVRM